MPTVLIGCRLPHGLVIKHPNPDVKVTVTLAGLFSSKLRTVDHKPAVDHVITSVDQELWDAWKHAYRDFAPLKNGAIFEAKTHQDAAMKAKDLSKEKTGFESVDPNSLGVKKLDKE